MLTSSAVSRVVGVDTKYKDFNVGDAAMLPQRLAIIGQGNDDAVYTEDRFECDGSAVSVAERFGYGSPLHLAARQLYPVAGGGGAVFPVTIYPVKKVENAVAATGKIKIVGTATKAGSGIVSIGGADAQFTVPKGYTGDNTLDAIKDAINGILEMPVKAGEIATSELTLTAKWGGAIGNDISIAVEMTGGDGLTITTTEFANGAGTPDVNPALEKIGETWETFVLNTLGYTASGLLDKYQVWGEGRWSALEKKPVLVATGCVDDYATRTAVTDERKTDWINFLVVSSGSPELPFVVAAKGLVSDIMTTANSDPAMGYKGLLTGLKAGADVESYTVRNNSVLKGSSTNIKNGNVAELNDIVTMWHPANENPKTFSKSRVVALVKLMNVVFNVRLILESDEVKSAPILPDEDVTSNPNAKQPKDFRTWFAILTDSLTNKALLSDAKYTKKNMLVEIDSENPNRINVRFPVKLSGNIEVVGAEVQFGYYLPSAA